MCVSLPEDTIDLEVEHPATVKHISLLGRTEITETPGYSTRIVTLT